MRLNTCTKLHEYILDGFKVIEKTRFSKEKMTKGHNSVTNKAGVTILFLCTLSDSGLYLYQVSFKYSGRCWGWSGGAMVLGKLTVPGRLTIWMTVGKGLLRLQ